MNIALVGNDGRANALKWHFEKYGHRVAMGETVTFLVEKRSY